MSRLRDNIQRALRPYPLCYSACRRVLRAVEGIASSRPFERDFRRFRESSLRVDHRFPVDWADRYPCSGEGTSSMGFDRHYVYHTAWAARVLARTKPPVHVDVSSSLYFAALVSAFVPVRYYEYRAAQIELSDLTSDTGSLDRLPFADRSISSLSCMHVIEHIGLGRYGDPIDPLADLQAFAELQRVLAPGGDLLMVVPVGRPRVCFNAHRVYGYEQVVESLPELSLTEFALIPDSAETGHLMVNPPIELVEQQEYACGCFWFTRSAVECGAASKDQGVVGCG